MTEFPTTTADRAEPNGSRAAGSGGVLLGEPPAAPSAASPAPSRSGPSGTVVSGATPASPWRKVALFSVIALLVGVGIGFVVGLPGKNSIADQRDTARASVTQLTKDLATANSSLSASQADLVTANAKSAQLTKDLSSSAADLTAANGELASTKTNLDHAVTVKDACLAASTAGVDLVAQWENLWLDFDNYLGTNYGSAAEAQMISHLDEQVQKMDAQHVEMDRLAGICVAG